MYSAQLGAENSAPATFAGLLHTPPLRIDHCRLPLVAVAAQITLPAPSLVQLGLELTGPARLFHVPHVVPLNRFTITAALPPGPTPGRPAKVAGTISFASFGFLRSSSL